MPTPMSWKTVCLAIVLALALCLGAWGQAPAEEIEGPIRPSPNPMNVTTDIPILRPVGLIMIPVTSIIYVIGYPFAKASGSEDDAYRSLVGNTIDFTFERPLGRGAPFE
ncbi:MAG: hypothetical protein JJV98_13025 [Desulfosarcina sp.]|nr:hypothetical protein [Desulfobacterales bacterium]